MDRRVHVQVYPVQLRCAQWALPVAHLHPQDALSFPEGFVLVRQETFRATELASPKAVHIAIRGVRRRHRTAALLFSTDAAACVRPDPNAAMTANANAYSTDASFRENQEQSLLEISNNTKRNEFSSA